MMTTYDNPLIDSGEYTRLYAVEVPIGARLIGMRDNDGVPTGDSASVRDVNGNNVGEWSYVSEY